MNCRRAKQLIYDYLDGIIGDSDRITLERHLSECRSCETFTTQLGKSLDLLHRAPEEMPSDNFNWMVRLRLAQEKNAIGMAAQRDLFRTWNLRFALSALSTFVLIVAGGILLWNSGLLPRPGTPALYTTQQPAADRASRPTPADRVALPTAPSRYIMPPQTLYLPTANYPSTQVADSYQRAIDESPLPVYQNPDSLVLQALMSKELRYRLRHLQDQVEHLQKNLRECEGGQ
jgi:hypothetical protein